MISDLEICILRLFKEKKGEVKNRKRFVFNMFCGDRWTH